MLQLSPDRIGMWDYHLNYHGADRVRAWTRELEDLGVASIWVGEALYREPFTLAGLLLSATERLVVATGIANIWVRDAFATTAAQLTLAEAYPDRFLLGIGVSHARLVEGQRGHHYDKPLTKMREYLDGMDKAFEVYKAVKPPERPPRMIAALGPRMLELAAERADGAHTYFVPPEHTERARSILGPDPMLVVEQAVVLDEDPTKAREIASSHVRRYLPLPNYTRNLERLGFTDDDFTAHGSDRLVDAVVAYGHTSAIAERIKQHIDAGATHVCLHVLSFQRHAFPIAEWRRVAAALDRSSVMGFDTDNTDGYI